MQQHSKQATVIVRAGSSPEVLIVGAGPVGIALACEFLQQGVEVRLIDKLDRIKTTDPHSRGILVWPRSLELLRRIKVSDRLVEAGHRTPGVNYYSEGRLLGTAHIARLSDSPYAFVLTLAQRETERVLRERLTELGGTVDQGVTLEALDTTGDLPRARLRHADGAQESVTPQWLVGADGPASTVRTLLGIRFDGEPIDVTYAIGDGPITGLVPTNAQYYYSRHGVVALVPLGAGHYRIAANVPHREEADGDPPRDLLQEVVDRRARVPVTIGEPVWTKSFRPRLGIAERFRSGRCFLVGDAAHVISPAGGQGMNIGFQDAVNLSWKLGGVICGRLSEAVLDTYHLERMAGAIRMSRTSAAQARFALQRSTPRIAARDAIFTTAHLTGVVQRVLVPLLSQTDVSYGDQDMDRFWRLDRGPIQVGRRMPMFAPPAQDNGVPALDPYRYTVVLWPGRQVPTRWAATSLHLRQQCFGHTPVLDLAEVPATAVRALRQSFGEHPTVAVVRPDGHLAQLAPVDKPEEVLAFIRAAELATVTVPSQPNASLTAG